MLVVLQLAALEKAPRPLRVSAALGADWHFSRFGIMNPFSWICST